MHPVVNIAVTAARNAGQIINRSMEKLTSISLTDKQRNDFAKEVEKLAEKEIITTLRKSYASHTIMTKEYSQLIKEEENLWIITALDGTTNYSYGLPHFCVSIALVQKGKIQHAVVFDPLNQELFTASRGEGARLNERRIRVSQCKKLDEALIGTNLPKPDNELFRKYLSTCSSIAPQAANLRCLGTSALQLAYLAASRIDGYWELEANECEIAAGTLLIKEAGGLVTDFNGEEKYLENGHIVAGNSKVVKGLLQAIESRFKEFCE